MPDNGDPLGEYRLLLGRGASFVEGKYGRSGEQLVRHFARKYAVPVSCNAAAASKVVLEPVDGRTVGRIRAWKFAVDSARSAVSREA